MGQIYGAVEFRVEEQWLAVINISSLLLRHCDLYGCLFGVDNFAGYVPLFADRGVPEDLSVDLENEVSPLHEHSHPSWVLWSELKQVDWDELAPRKRRDALTDTDFPLLMKLMASLAERFGDDGVRLTVWFD